MDPKTKIRGIVLDALMKQQNGNEAIVLIADEAMSSVEDVLQEVRDFENLCPGCCEVIPDDKKFNHSDYCNS